MQANKTILQMKYARVVQQFADNVGMKYEDALGVFYNSDVYKMMSQGIADMHCLSDGYLADELKQELFNKVKGSWKCDGLTAEEETLAAMADAKAGRTIKCKDFEDYLEKVKE